MGAPKKLGSEDLADLYVQPPIQPPYAITPSHTTHQAKTVDTLTSATQPISTKFSIPLSTPQLTAPYPAYALFQSIEKLHQAGRYGTQVFKEGVEKDQARLKIQSNEHAKELKASAERLKESDTWDSLKNLATSFLTVVTSSVAAFFGMTLLASGTSPMVGGLLLSAGVTAMANLAISQADGWTQAADRLFPDEPEKKEAFLKYIPTAIGIVSNSICMLGAGAITLMNTQAFYEQIVTVAYAAAAGATGVTSVGEGVAHARVDMAKAALKVRENEMFLIQNSLGKVSGTLEKLLKLIAESFEKGSRIAQLLIHPNEVILRG